MLARRTVHSPVPLVRKPVSLAPLSDWTWPRRFYAKVAKLIDVPWDMAVGADLRHRHVLGARSGKTAFLNGYIARLFVAAPRHPAVASAFLSVANLMSPPQKLFAPASATTSS